MTKDGVISLCSKARQALAQAKTIEDFKDVRDVGEAAIRLAKLGAYDTGKRGRSFQLQESESRVEGGCSEHAGPGKE